MIALNARPWAEVFPAYCAMFDALGAKEVRRRTGASLSAVYFWRSDEKEPRGLSLAVVGRVVEDWSVSTSRNARLARAP